MLPYRNLSQREARNFITSFKPEEDKIIVNYANKTNQKIENNEENKDNLINKMENQVLEHKECTNLEMRSSMLWFSVSILDSCFAIDKLISLSQEKTVTATYMATAIVATITWYRITQIWNDHYKNEMFLENKYFINKAIAEGVNIPKRKKRLIKKIKDLTENDEILDINNVANFTKDEILYLINLSKNNGNYQNPILKFLKGDN